MKCVTLCDGDAYIGGTFEGQQTQWGVSKEKKEEAMKHIMQLIQLRVPVREFKGTFLQGFEKLKFIL